MNRYTAEAPIIPADLMTTYNQSMSPCVNLLMAVLPLLASLPSAKASPWIGNPATVQPSQTPPFGQPALAPSTSLPINDKGHPAHLSFYFSQVFTSTLPGARPKVFFQPKFEKERKGEWTWNKWVCEQYGTEMVSVHSAEENEFLTSWLESTAVGMKNPGTWLGARISNANPRFNWESGAVGGYSNWKSGEPNEGGETCLHLGWAKPYQQWWNFHCNETRMLTACQMFVGNPVVPPAPSPSFVSPRTHFPQIQNLMLCVVGQLREEDVTKVGFAYQFDIFREGSSAVVAQYHLDLKNGRRSAGAGAHASPDVTFTLSDADFMRMFKGETDGTALIIQGRLKLNPVLAIGPALKLAEVLKKSENDQRASCA